MAGCMEGSSSQGFIQCLLIGLILPKDKCKGPVIIYVEGGGGVGEKCWACQIFYVAPPIRVCK